MAEYTVKKYCDNCPMFTHDEYEACNHPMVVADHGSTPTCGFREIYYGESEQVPSKESGGKWIYYNTVPPSWCPLRKDSKLTIIFEE